MAQLEDGYTRIANEILEKVYRSKFNGTQFSILLFVWRNTYGFQRKSHDLSLNYIATGIETHKDQVKRELDRLILWNIITVYQEASFNKTRVIGFNKNSDDWQIDSSEKSIQSSKTSTVIEEVGEQSANKSTPTVDVLAHQERKSFKDIKETYIAHFDQFWNLYPSKKGRAKALTKWLILSPKLDFEKVIEGTQAYIKFIEYGKANGKTREFKDGSTFINQETWNDDWSIKSLNIAPSYKPSDIEANNAKRLADERKEAVKPVYGPADEIKEVS